MFRDVLLPGSRVDFLVFSPELGQVVVIASEHTRRGRCRQTRVPHGNVGRYIKKKKKHLLGTNDLVGT